MEVGVHSMAQQNATATHVIKGVVDRIFTKTVKTGYGDKEIHHGSCDGIEFSTGFKAEVASGEVINLPVAWQYGNWQYVPVADAMRDTLPQVTLAETTANAPAASSGGGGGGRKGYGKFPVDPLDGQMSIIRQNSMNRAVEIVENMMTASPSVFDPKGNEEAYLKKLIQIALTITDFNSGQDIMQLKAAQAANLAAAA